MAPSLLCRKRGLCCAPRFRGPSVPFVIWEIVVLGLTAPLWSRCARIHGGIGREFLSCFPCWQFVLAFTFVLTTSSWCCRRPRCARELAYGRRGETVLERQFGRLAGWLPVLYFAVVFGISVRGQYKTYFHLDPAALNRKIFGHDPFSEAVAAGSYIKTHSSEQDTIGLFGSEPEICFYSARHCASSYLYTYPLMEKQKFARQMQAEMIEQVQDARPRFLIYADVARSWGTKATLEENRGFLEMAWAFTLTVTMSWWTK
jgi:hypothetical protein